uniref:Formylglycine-generating enzyme, required for sulfatase activity, contains SUMF1/FGE domain n=1 Tax=Candidatus Kentrum sp. MB TaxID=2138164 RepID=A0A450X700_9GAMM|nr:MAG: Formylglycine-generating enzyme, required for sulfatase activity, contains SUMF1/FGE domain [Candidatus Kentron sp. MB]
MEKKQKNREGKRTIRHRGEILTTEHLIPGKSGHAGSDVIPDKAAYKRNLHHYEITFSRALEKTYPELDRTVREQLRRRSETLGLAAEDVARIEDQVTAKAIAYRANLQQYRQIFRNFVREQYPIDAQRHRELKQRQRILGLQEADITAIEDEIANEKVVSDAKRYRKTLHPPAAFQEPKPKITPPVRETPASRDAGTPIPAKPSSRAMVIRLLALLIVIIIGLGIYLWSRNGVEHSSPSTTSPASSSSAEPRPEATLAVGKLIVRSNVSKDSVYIDDQAVGPTGPDPHILTAGEHRIRVEKLGYQPFETRITLKPKEQKTVHARLMPPNPTIGQVFQDRFKDGSLGPAMIALAAGEFLMGSGDAEVMRYHGEGPQHRVRIAQPFALGVTVVTFEEYDRFVKATGRRSPHDGGWGRGKQPVININWHDAAAYTKWLTQQTGNQYRLPTEAEWEYAARAGTTTPFSTGKCVHTDSVNYKGDYDYADCGARTGLSRGKPVPAGSLPANPWGLHEMHGNVWEWTADCWHASYKNAPVDGSPWGKENRGNCAERVVRGGSWGSGARSVRSAVRSWDWATVKNVDLGFRVVRGLSP